MIPETSEAKLRNQLTPLYSLASSVLLLKDRPDMLPIILEMAEKSLSCKEEIDRLLLEIESKQPNAISPISYTGITFLSGDATPKYCTCKRQFDSTAKFLCDNNCR